VGKTGTPNFVASNNTAITSLTPPGGNYRSGKKLNGPGLQELLETSHGYGNAHRSDADGIYGLAIAAWPSTSSGLVGS